MARMARAVFSGVPHHVTQRGNRRQRVFFCDGDYRLYKSLVAQYCAKFEIEIWAYCLMPNHVHLVVVPRNGKLLAGAIGEAHRRYTRAINLRKNWRGYLWQGRFSSFAMDEFHLQSAVRYVELNPVKGGLVNAAEQWQWSSARAHLCGTDDQMVKVAPMLERVGSWPEYLASGTDSHDEELALHERTGRPLGDESFIERLEKLAGRRLRPGKPGIKQQPR